ncbi:MAG TPA: GNAT family N-acetyltransferase [Puia sp.]|nr:GNAT family N-acetyltransferase [Puia sp.]
MNIRLFTNDDLTACTKIFVNTYNQAPWNYHWELQAAETYLSEYISSKYFAGYVLCDESGIAAAMFGHKKTWWTGSTLYIDELFVSPNKQGVGYGKQLMACAEKYCKENGCSNITLMTNRHMPAFKFYNKLDFISADQNVFLFKLIE